MRPFGVVPVRHQGIAVRGIRKLLFTTPIPSIRAAPTNTGRKKRWVERRRTGPESVRCSAGAQATVNMAASNDSASQRRS